jgi:hypothetical protein
MKLFRLVDELVYDMILKIMDEFELTPDDLEAYQKEKRSRLAKLRRILEMAPDKQVVPHHWKGSNPMG